jgi:hypothetical protein
MRIWAANSAAGFLAPIQVLDSLCPTPSDRKERMTIDVRQESGGERQATVTRVSAPCRETRATLVEFDGSVRATGGIGHFINHPAVRKNIAIRSKAFRCGHKRSSFAVCSACFRLFSLVSLIFAWLWARAQSETAKGEWFAVRLTKGGFFAFGYRLISALSGKIRLYSPFCGRQPAEGCEPEWGPAEARTLSRAGGGRKMQNRGVFAAGKVKSSGFARDCPPCPPLPAFLCGGRFLGDREGNDQTRPANEAHLHLPTRYPGSLRSVWRTFISARDLRCTCQLSPALKPLTPPAPLPRFALYFLRKNRLDFVKSFIEA